MTFPKTAPRNAWTHEADFDGLIPYIGREAAWSAAHSNISFAWPRSDEPGLQLLQTMVGWSGALITERLLRWHLDVDGQRIEPTLQSRIFRPDAVVETDEAGPITIECRCAFPCRNAVSNTFALRNTSAAPVTFKLRFDDPASPPDAGQIRTGAPLRFLTEPPGSWACQFIHHEHGRNFLWVSDHVAGMNDGATLDLICLSDTSPRTLTLEPGQEATHTVNLCFGLNLERAHATRTACAAIRDEGWTPHSATDRLLDRLQHAAELPEPTPQRQRMFAHAITGLDGLFIAGEGGFTGTKRIPWTAKGGLAIAFFWDTAFSVLGAAEYDARMGQEAVRCFTENASCRGSMPGTLCDTHRAGDGQAPILAWAAWRLHQVAPDLGFLADVYPAMGNYVTFWRAFHSSPRGFFQWYNGGQIADNDARFDPVYGEERGNEPVSGLESPDLNALFALNMRILAKMARELGRPQEAAEWDRQANELTNALVDAFYFPERAMFLDVAEGTREIFSGVKGPNMFFPLLLDDLPLPEDEVRRIIESHMLNPDESFRPLPFPSLSYDDPKFDPEGYWRGRVWPHIGFIMLQILWKHGYRDQADQCADWFLDLYNQTPWFHENYYGAPLEPEQPSRPTHGVREYNWAQATVIRLLLRRYRDPIC